MPQKKTAKKSAPARASVVQTPKGIAVHCMHHELVELDSLRPNPRNPNKHPDKQLVVLADIIMGQGWRNSIVVSRRSGLIVKGHGRHAAGYIIKAKTGETKVPIEYQDYGSAAEELADLLADNKIAEFAELDLAVVETLGRDIIASMPEFDLTLTGFGLATFDLPAPLATPSNELAGEGTQQVKRVQLAYGGDDSKRFKELIDSLRVKFSTQLKRRSKGKTDVQVSDVVMLALEVAARSK